MSAPETAIYIRPRMGTLLGLTIQAPASIAERAAGRAFTLASTLEYLMTRFDPASALNRITRAAGRRVTVPAELARALSAARCLAKLTGGAFDPTVAPLVDLWRDAARRGEMPSRHELARAQRLVGWQALSIRGRRIRLARAGMALDLGGIGKGWAADRIASTLRRVEGLSALVNFGESSLVAIRGPQPHGSWPVLLRHPDGRLAGWFTLADWACSTSASLGRRWRIGRHKIGHLIAPRSGQPLASSAQVTVLARTATVAEALSTALLVLGRAAFLTVARRFQIEACWIDREGIVTTPRFTLHRWQSEPCA
jgi:thiamine biosynthesis lipoprotein